MIRKIIHIDEEKCNGCGLCAEACHEGAIDIIDGKAKLVREHFCDGLGDCLPNCPQGAITFEEREAPAYDEAAVMESKQQKVKKETSMNTLKEVKEACENTKPNDMKIPHTCPGSAARSIKRNFTIAGHQAEEAAAEKSPMKVLPIKENPAMNTPQVSELVNWPVQIKLAPVRAEYFDGAKLLIAADCTAYAYASFHQDFIRGKVTLIGCPKLDAIDYSEKLTEIIRQNDIKSVTIVRMEVPCCGGLEHAAKKALQESGKFIPWQVVTIGIDGTILDR